MIYPLFSEVMLTEDIPEYGLTRYQTGVVVEHYSGLNGQEDGYSIEGLIPNNTVEVTESQIQKVAKKIIRFPHFTHIKSERNNKSLNGQKNVHRSSTKTNNKIFYDNKSENDNLGI